MWSGLQIIERAVVGGVVSRNGEKLWLEPELLKCLLNYLVFASVRSFELDKLNNLYRTEDEQKVIDIPLLLPCRVCFVFVGGGQGELRKGFNVKFRPDAAGPPVNLQYWIECAAAEEGYEERDDDDTAEKAVKPRTRRHD
ncbi:hypothetical protein HRG_013204 [Hirsutella rhossiliensis]